MNQKNNDRDLDQLIRLGRPAPIPPPVDEYSRLLAAALQEAAAPAPAAFRIVPWAVAATFVIALAAAFFMDDGHPTAASRARDDRMEAFLSDTLGEVITERNAPAPAEPFNIYDPAVENGSQ